MLEIGVNLPTLGEIQAQGVPDVRSAARHIEELGFESVWAADLIVGDSTPSLESVVVLTTAAAVTDRVRVGFGVLSLPLRPVAWVAAQVATLQHVSGDRVVLGVGSGGFPDTPFWEAVGVPGRERGRRTDAALDVLPRLIAGEPTRLPHNSGHVEVTLAPGASVPPILIGGSSDVAIRRAAVHGHGWLPSLLAPDALAAGVQKLHDLAAEHRHASPRIGFGTHAVLGSDESSRVTRDALVRSLVDDHGVPPKEAARIPITGSTAEAAERLAAYAEAGAEHLVLTLDGEDWMRQCERLADARARLGALPPPSGASGGRPG